MRKLNKISVIASVLMLTIAIALVALPAATAQEYPTKKTYAYIGAVPNPVGKGQPVLLHVGITDYLLIATDSWKGLWVTIEKPDDTTETIDDIETDSTGGTGVVYTPDQTGTYYLQTHFPEQVYNWTSPPAFNPALYGPVTYLASVSDKLALVVQEEPVEYYPGQPLPAEYWTRPIDAQLREWYTISGNWFETPPNVFAPYNDGPETAHILWAKDLIRGGLSGGDTGEHAHDCGDAYRGRWQSAVIVDGILVYPRFPSTFTGPLNPQQGIVAVDLHTGEELWFRNNTGLSFGQTMYWSSRNMHGTFSYIWEVKTLYLPPTFAPVNIWNAYDPLTGEWMFTMENVPDLGVMFGPSMNRRGPKGEIIIYELDLENGWMTMWNSSNVAALRGGEDPEAGMFGFVYYSWMPEGKTVDATGPCFTTPRNPLGLNGYHWNVTIPAGLPGGVSFVLEDRIIGTNLGAIGGTAPPEVVFWGISTTPEDKGDLLFNETWTPPSGDLEISTSAASLEDGVFTVWIKELRQHYGFSLETGKKLWGPTDKQYYLDIFYATTNHIAYGKLYSAGASGIVYCYDVKTGDLLWDYHATDTYQEILWANDWWVSSIFITDGKLYFGTEEHSVIDPKPRGAPFYCLNATTGDEIFRIDGAFRQTHWGGYAIIGDSIIATMDTYDQRIYAIGKGPSAIEVSASPKVIANGDSILIEGMVTDVSPGTKEYALTARFPNGVPAVADEHMSDWMLYVYKQFPAPMDVTGVDVLLQAMNSNGTITELGWVKSDGAGYFSFIWTPPDEDAYTIMAIFMGSKAYWPSYTQTSVGVTAALEEPAEPAYLTMDLVIIAVVVIIAIVVVYTLFTVRKLRK